MNITYCLENNILFSFTVYKVNASPQTYKQHTVMVTDVPLLKINIQALHPQ